MAGAQLSESGTDRHQWCSHAILVSATPVLTEQNKAQVFMCRIGKEKNPVLIAYSQISMV